MADLTNKGSLLGVAESELCLVKVSLRLKVEPSYAVNCCELTYINLHVNLRGWQLDSNIKCRQTPLFQDFYEPVGDNRSVDKVALSKV